jgi:selenocysteine lyase/cysteine desulfurase
MTLPDRIRSRFPIFDRRVYVNSCSHGALSDSVRAAYAEYLGSWEREGSPWELWVERVEAARGAFAALVNATSDEIAVTSSLSAGASSLLSGLRPQGGRTRLVISDLEFPTVGQIAHAQEPLGWEVIHARAEGGEVPLERFEELVDERTALVCVTAISYRTGARLDVESVVRLAHQHGALALVDAYQAAGVAPIDVQALGCDFLAAGCVKYLLGSAGLAFLYCRRDLCERILPTVTGWFADEDVFAMDHTDYSPAGTARRFESGTPPVPSVYAGLAGLELVREIGVEAASEHVGGLADALIDGVEALGGRVVTPKAPDRRGPLVAIAARNEHALVAALAEDGVVTSSRAGNLRVSFHGYNSREDVSAVLAALARHRNLLA